MTANSKPLDLAHFTLLIHIKPADAAPALLAECKRQRGQIAKLREALEDLTLRCDGAEGIRADGSNIQTIKAHAALGTFAEEE